MRMALLIMLAGALGAGSRYAVGKLATRLLGEWFPFGTLAVNLCGAFLLGLLLPVGISTLPKEYKAALATGFLGAFTTFTTFANDTVRLSQQEHWWLTGANVMANVVLGLVCAWVGFNLSNRLFAS